MYFTADFTLYTATVYPVSSVVKFQFSQVEEFLLVAAFRGKIFLGHPSDSFMILLRTIKNDRGRP